MKKAADVSKLFLAIFESLMMVYIYLLLFVAAVCLYQK